MVTQIRNSFLVSLPILGCLCGSAAAQTLSGSALVSALRQGGYVLVMRHADAPMTPPDASAAEPDNKTRERQLSPAGKTAAAAVGAAVKRLGIPVGLILSSPAYRARETVRLAALGTPQIAPQLSEDSQGMMTPANMTSAAWLKNEAAQEPKEGTDSFIITHTPNIAGAFGAEAASIAPGEALVFHPDGKGGADLVARIKTDQWTRLSAP